MSITKDEVIIKMGYYPNPKIFIPSDSLLEKIEKIQSLDFANTDYEVSRMNIKDALFDAKKFLDYYYKLHRVPIIYKEIGHHHFPIALNNHPYKIPIVPILDETTIFDGTTLEEITKDKRSKVLFKGIELSKIVTETTSATYVHELTHTQLDSVKGSIRNYYNAEILSMFNELFHYMILGGKENLLRLNDSRRIAELSLIFIDLENYKKGDTSMTREELLEDSKYAVSILKSYNLFTIFYYGSEKLQNEILDDIQCIFDGYLTLEEMLKKYDITLESSQDEKRLLKYFNR